MLQLCLRMVDMRPYHTNSDVGIEKLNVLWLRIAGPRQMESRSHDKSSSHDNSFLRYICFGIPQTWFPLCTSIAFFNSFVLKRKNHQWMIAGAKELINYPHLKPMVKTFTKNSDCKLPYLVALSNYL